MKITLFDWQKKIKPQSLLIVQASIKDGSDSWLQWPIGMSWQYILNYMKGDSLQLGEHDNLVLSTINIYTDKRRRPTGVNRETIAKTLSNNGIQTTTIDHQEYFSKLPTYKFVISPEGNGIDCHRHYEALLAGAIPIMEKNPKTEEKYKGCPILWTTDYSEITAEYLLAKYNEMINEEYDFSCLFLSHYSLEQQSIIKEYGNHWINHCTNNIWYKPVSMNIVYAFVGVLPSYCIDTVFQTRLFYDGPIYFILNDYQSIFIPILKQYNVIIINYDTVLDNDFNNLVEKSKNRFCIVPNLTGRERLFIHSFERFYILHNLMKQNSLRDVFFMELDNLIYDDPINWLKTFAKKDMAYMFDNYDRSSSGIAYIKNTDILKEFMKFSNTYILTDTGFINEMTSLFRFWELNKESVQLLPTLWPDVNYPTMTYETFPLYNNSIFDALSIGIYIAGADATQIGGVIVKGQRSTWGLVDYTKYVYKWKKDSQQRNTPFIFTGDHWLKVNNLHVHSKDLRPYLSKNL